MIAVKTTLQDILLFGPSIFTEFSSKRLLGTKCTQNSKKKKILAEKEEEEEDNSGCGKRKQNVSINTT